MKDLKKFIGTFFIHTAKAIRKGHPSDRLFCVVKIERDPDGCPKEFLCAWKVGRKSENIFWHPVLGEISVERLADLDLFLLGVVTDSTPTAIFIPDSFYQQVTLQEAIEKLVPQKPGWKS